MMKVVGSYDRTNSPKDRRLKHQRVANALNRLELNKQHAGHGRLS